MEKPYYIRKLSCGRYTTNFMTPIDILKHRY